MFPTGATADWSVLRPGALLWWRGCLQTVIEGTNLPDMESRVHHCNPAWSWEEQPALWIPHECCNSAMNAPHGAVLCLPLLPTVLAHVYESNRSLKKVPIYTTLGFHMIGCCSLSSHFWIYEPSIPIHKFQFSFFPIVDLTKQENRRLSASFVSSNSCAEWPARGMVDIQGLCELRRL